MGIIKAPDAIVPYPDGDGGKFDCPFDALLCYGMDQAGDLMEGRS